MTHQSYREESRKNWGNDSINGAPTEDQLKLGALLRIADATEKMAQRHTDLIRERDSFEANAHYFKRKLDEELRRSAALRGQITKLKKRLAVAQMQAFGGDPRGVAFKQDGKVET